MLKRQRNIGAAKTRMKTFFRFISFAYLYNVWFWYQTVLFISYIFTLSIMQAAHIIKMVDIYRIFLLFLYLPFTWNGSSFHIILDTTRLSGYTCRILKSTIRVKYYQDAIYFIHSNPICNKSICICLNGVTR